jgi:hypothetical protein
LTVGQVHRAIPAAINKKNMNTKINNWLAALYVQLEAFNEKPFEWGSHDCCTFAADCVLAMTGEDRMVTHRGGYKTAIGATRKMARLGGMEATITSVLGEPIAPAFAQRGDVVCFTSPLGDTCGVCVGSTIAAAGLYGITHTPMVQAFKAWKV